MSYRSLFERFVQRQFHPDEFSSSPLSPPIRFLARSLKASSKFGAAFDQLADLTCFGVGPAIFYIRHELRQVLPIQDSTTTSTVSLWTWGPDGQNTASSKLAQIFGPAVLLYVPNPSWLFIFGSGCLKEMLETMTYDKLIEMQATRAENMNKQLKYVPIPNGMSIFMG